MCEDMELDELREWWVIQLDQKEEAKWGSVERAGEAVWGQALHSCSNHVEWVGIDPERDEKPWMNFYQRNEVARDGLVNVHALEWGSGG